MNEKIVVSLRALTWSSYYLLTVVVPRLVVLMVWSLETPYLCPQMLTAIHGCVHLGHIEGMNL